MTQADAPTTTVTVPDATASGTTVPDATDIAPEPRLGRRRDPSRDADILDATLDVLAEVGYDGMTVDMVAARAKAGKATVYRRWASKSALVVDAVACLKGPMVGLDQLPDTGSLRGDLVALIKKPATLADAQRKSAIMSGLFSLMEREPELAAEVHRVIMEPRVAVTRALVQRAIARGEARPDCNVELIAQLSPAIVSFRRMLLKDPPSRAELVEIIDDLIIPAACGRPAD